MINHPLDSVVHLAINLALDGPVYLLLLVLFQEI